ncbi:MAG: M20/M25/M40 family metallo-hydrolase [Myxococcales bacterium]|nr:M20/M25/M40 family metallo-hydrolase [Myxococcales bacterium]
MSSRQEFGPTRVAELLERTREYIDIPSISGSEASFLRRLESDFKAKGYRVTRQPVSDGRWNLLASPKGQIDLLFCTHVDVVPPHIGGRIDTALRDGRTVPAVFGRGACDTKGGLVAMQEAADELDRERARVGFLLVVGEEVDHVGAIHAARLKLAPLGIVLCEPTRGELVVGQKGLLKFRLDTEGEAAHSAFPELGKDALGPMLDTLQRFRSATYETHPLLGDTTLNVGILRSGVAANITPPSATAEVLYRAATDPEELMSQVRSMLSPGVQLSEVSQNPPIELASAPGFNHIQIAFNTDAFYLQPLAPVYLMGPGDIAYAHGDNEHITGDELERGVGDFVRLGRFILDGSRAS